MRESVNMVSGLISQKLLEKNVTEYLENTLKILIYLLILLKWLLYQV